MTRQIIPLKFYYWFFEKHPKIFIGCVLCFCFVIIPIVHIGIDKDWFKRKAIEVKYCYHWDGDTIRPYRFYSKGKRVKCFEKAYWMLAYYYTPILCSLIRIRNIICRTFVSKIGFTRWRSCVIARILCWQSLDTSILRLVFMEKMSAWFPHLLCTTHYPLDIRRRTKSI